MIMPKIRMAGSASYCKYLAYQGTMSGGHKGPFGNLV